MFSSKKLYWVAQIGGWSMYGLLLLLATYAENPADIGFAFLFSLGIYMFAGLLVTHVLRLFYLKSTWLELKLTPLIPRIIVVSILGSFVVACIKLMVQLSFNEFDTSSFSGLIFFIEIMAFSLLIILWNGIYFTYHFFQKSIRQELSNLKLQASQQEIELKNLRSQMNPHFLFNSLNSIRALIDIEPVKSKFAVTTLSNLLRKSLEFGNKNLVKLEEEIQLVKHYLELEKIRFEERLQIEWDLDKSINSVEIPPFILQTLAENAVKHGISNLIEGGTIIIRTKRLEDGISLQLENSGKIQEKTDLGIGLENTKRRLALQYKGKAHFTLEDKNGKVCCILEIKNT